jgi:hypothetical protein
LPADQAAFKGMYAYTLEQPKRDEQMLGEFLPDANELRGDYAEVCLTENDATAVAQNWVDEQGLSAEVRLDKVIDVQSGVDDIKVTSGHIARFIRRVQGHEVRSNGADDHINVFIRNGKVVGSSKRLSTVKQGPALLKTKVLAPSQVLARASSDLLRMTKSEMTLVDVKPCLGIKNNQLVPAYAFQDKTGAYVILDASTGSLLQ